MQASCNKFLWGKTHIGKLNIVNKGLLLLLQIFFVTCAFQSQVNELIKVSCGKVDHEIAVPAGEDVAWSRFQGCASVWAPILSEGFLPRFSSSESEKLL